MKTLAKLVTASLATLALMLGAHANPAQQQQSKGAPVQQTKPAFKGARVAPPTHQSVGDLYHQLMKQQPTQQRSQSK